MKNTAEQITTVESFYSPLESGTFPSITRGFNAGMAHMYQNPVELELRTIAQAERAAENVDALILSFRSLLF